jgi:predicted ATPase
MFEELTFRNFLSFGPEAEPVRLGRLNVLVGPNGSGKSNFLDGIGLLAGCTRKGALGRMLAAGGGVEAWLHQPHVEVSIESVEASLEAVVHLEFYPQYSPSLRHRFDFHKSKGWGANPILNYERIEALGYGEAELLVGIEQEDRVLNAHGVKRVIGPGSFNSLDSITAQLADPEQFEWLYHLTRFYEGIRLYRDWTFGRSAGIRRPGATDAASDYLHPDASNLAMVINGLKRGVRQQIVERLQDLAPTFTGIETKVLASTIQLFLLEGDHEISALRLSDGTLRYLAMLVMLLHPNPPPVTVIEEPELGLHPDLLPGLARLMLDASARTQIIATTHSDILIDALTEHPEAIRVCEKDEHGTSIRPIDPESLKPWLEEHGLGGAWLRGAIGGSRW